MRQIKRRALFSQPHIFHKFHPGADGRLRIWLKLVPLFFKNCFQPRQFLSRPGQSHSPALLPQTGEPGQQFLLGREQAAPKQVCQGFLHLIQKPLQGFYRR